MQAATGRSLNSYVLVLAIAISVAAAVYWFSRTSAEPVIPAAPQRVSGTAEVPTKTVEEDVSATPKAGSETKQQAARVRLAALTPLPDNAMPLVEQLPALLQRAEAGDLVASCRLIISIDRCKEEQRSQQFTQDMLRSMEAKAGKNDEMMIRIVAHNREQQEKKGGYCEGVESRSLPRTDDLFRRSLHLLSPRQKTILALTQSDGTLRQLRGRASFSESGLYVIPQYLADHTVDFLMAGYQARDPLALEGLTMLYAPGNAVSPQGVGVWLPNPRLFLQYSMLMHELFGPESLGRSALQLMSITAASIALEERESIHRLVQAEANQWRQAAANDRRPPTPRDVGGTRTDLTGCAE